MNTKSFSTMNVPQYQVLVGHDDEEKCEELVAYNVLVNLINDDESQEGMWKFREIKGRFGPSDTNYKGSGWNVLVAWETGEITLEPLKNVSHEKAVCGIYVLNIAV
jgi:hypothetical protein